MRNVGHQVGVDRVGNLSETRPVQRAGITAEAGYLEKYG